MKPGRLIAAGVFLGYIVGALGIVLWPEHVSPGPLVAPAVRILDFLRVPHEHSFAVLEFVGNVVLFVPFGIAMALIGRRFLPVIGFGAGVSVGLESLQWVLPIARTPELSDVVANSLGAALGASLMICLCVSRCRHTAIATGTDFARRRRDRKDDD